MLSPLRAALCVAALSCGLTAQSASFAPFGSASGETFTGQQIQTAGLPQLGTTFSLGVSHAIPPFFCLQVLTPYAVWLALGTSKQAWLGVPLPTALPLGFDLLVSVDSVSQTLIFNTTSCPPGATGAFPSPFAVTVPNQPGLIGFQVHAQILMARLGALAGTPPIATNGVTVTVGY